MGNKCNAADEGVNISNYTRGPSNNTYSRSVSGGGFFAVWMDNGNRFGRNVSSRKYKKNIQTHHVDPDAVLALRPVVYDRIDDSEINAYGMIAEEVLELVPELVVFFEGEPDGLRYDLLSVALLDVVKQLDARLQVLEKKVIVAATTNYGFPYPVKGDGRQTAQDIEALAEAIDTKFAADARPWWSFVRWTTGSLGTGADAAMAGWDLQESNFSIGSPSLGGGIVVPKSWSLSCPGQCCISRDLGGCSVD